MVLKSFRFFFVFVLFIIQAATAQEAKVLTLQECIDIAIKNNSQLRNAERRVSQAQANAVIARSNFLPTLNMSMNSGKFIQGPRKTKQDVPVDFDPRTGLFVFEQRIITQARSERNFNTAQLRLSQQIWDFGRSLNGYKQARESKRAAEQSMLSTRQVVVLGTKVAYFELLKAQKLLEVYKEAVKLAEEQVDRAQTMMDIGLASQAEVLQAKVNLGSNKRNAITQANVVEMAKANLNTAIGWDPSTPIEVVEEKAEPTFIEYDFDEAARIAISNNPLIKSLELTAKSALFAYRAARAQYYPILSASVSYSRNNDDASRVYTTNLKEDYSASIGAQFDLNIFNGLRDKAEVQRQKLAYEMALEDLAEQKRLTVSEVKQYFLELEAYRDILEIQRENIEAAKENLRLQMEKRRVGSGTELDVTDAQVELTRAQSDYVNAEYDAQVAKARLLAAMGIIEK